MPKISVIVPVYKVEAYLQRCAESVLQQSFRDLELILVDDGSPDRCPAMCNALAEKDSRVHVIHQKNGGLSAARNSGLDWVEAHSDSGWIFFLDSDDWIHRDCLRKLLAGTENPRTGISVCEFIHMDRELPDAALEETSPLLMDPETAYADYYGLCMTAWCKLIRRDLLRGIRFPVGKLHEDAFVTHLLIFSAEKIAVVPQPLYYYYSNAQSITRKQWTPRRLEELEGHQVRLAYLQEHGLRRAAEAEQRVTILTLYEHTEALAGSSHPEAPQYLRRLRRQLRQALKEGKNLIPPDMETVWIYLMAWFPLPLWRLGKWAQGLWHRRNTGRT